jgi:hypothetical protein
MKSLNRFFIALFLNLSFLTIPLFAQQTKTPGQIPNMPDRLPQLTAEDLAAVEDLMKTLDKETLDELAKIGEQYIEEMKAQGRDPFEELFGVPADALEQEMQQAQNDFQAPTAPIQEPTKPISPDVQLPKACPAAKQCRAMLKHLAELLAEFENKTTQDRYFVDQLKPWKYHLQDIIYFAHAFAEEKLLNYLTDKEFEHVLKAFSALEQELTTLVPLFAIQEFELEEVNPYILLGTSTDASWQDVNVAYQKAYSQKHPSVVKQELEKQEKPKAIVQEAIAQAQQELDTLTSAYNTILEKEQAKQTFNSILDSFARAIYVNNILTESKKILERYAPEALKIKEQQEELEKKARKDQEEMARRRPTFTPPIFERSLPQRFSSGDSYQAPAPYVPHTGNGEKPEFKPTEIGGKKVPAGPGAQPAKPEKEKGEGQSKDKKDEAKKGASSRPTEDRRMTAKLKNIDVFGKIDDAFTKTDVDGILFENYFKEANIVKFQNYLIKGEELNVSEKDKKALDIAKRIVEGINTHLKDIITNLNRLQIEISDDGLKGFSVAQKKEIKEKAQKLFNEYFDEKAEGTKKLKGLITLPFTIEKTAEGKEKFVLDPAKLKPSDAIAFVHMGQGDPEKLKTKLPEPLKKMKPPVNYIDQFIDVFHKLKNKLKKS